MGKTNPHEEYNRGVKVARIVRHLQDVGIPWQQAIQMSPDWWLAISTAAGAQPKSAPKRVPSRATQTQVIGLMQPRPTTRRRST